MIEPAPFLLKVGREVRDPLNRVVTIIAVTADHVAVRLGGSYGATVIYPRSAMRPVEPV